jgi:hypothetical protein
MEFIARHPQNPYVATARHKIEQREYIRYEGLNTAPGYREFLAKYPDSTYAILARKRLRELDFRALAKRVEKDYAFDLLKYRLHVRRLKEKLRSSGDSDLADFTLDAALDGHNSKLRFRTDLLYSQAPKSVHPLPR